MDSYKFLFRMPICSIAVTCIKYSFYIYLKKLHVDGDCIEYRVHIRIISVNKIDILQIYNFVN